MHHREERELGSPAHVPIRTCVVCSAKKPRQSLTRLCVDPTDGLVFVDLKGCYSGRGAYACEGCIPHLRMNPRIRKAFRNKAKGLKTQD